MAPVVTTLTPRNTPTAVPVPVETAALTARAKMSALLFASTVRFVAAAMLEFLISTRAPLPVMVLEARFTVMELDVPTETAAPSTIARMRTLLLATILILSLALNVEFATATFTSVSTAFTATIPLMLEALPTVKPRLKFTEMMLEAKSMPLVAMAS